MASNLMRFRAMIFAFAVGMVAPLATAQDEATKKTIKRLVEEIELVPSLYATESETVAIKSLPTFSAKKLLAFALDKQDTFARQRESYRTKKDRYVRDYPLRASIFEAAEEIEKLHKADLALTIAKSELTPKGRAALLQRQGYLGAASARLEQVLARMNAAAREPDASKHWQADFDFARARVELNLVFLYELNYALGRFRAEKLPPLGPGETGWAIAFRPKLSSEGKAKTLLADSRKHLVKMQQDYAETPWAYFAEREAKREPGLAWVAR